MGHYALDEENKTLFHTGDNVQVNLTIEEVQTLLKGKIRDRNYCFELLNDGRGIY